jgi:hypothetical protein
MREVAGPSAPQIAICFKGSTAPLFVEVVVVNPGGEEFDDAPGGFSDGATALREHWRDHFMAHDFGS